MSHLPPTLKMCNACATRDRSYFVVNVLQVIADYLNHRSPVFSFRIASETPRGASDFGNSTRPYSPVGAPAGKYLTWQWGLTHERAS
jgi:hypothetical protein